MARIALSRQEASLILSGYLDKKTGEDPSFRLREGKGTATGDRLQIHYLGYMSKQEVNHYRTIGFDEVVDEKKIMEDAEDLLNFLDNPLEAEITKEEAKAIKDEIILNPSTYTSCIVDPEVENCIKTVDGEEETR